MRRKQDTNMIICFLKGLNESFSNIKSQVMAMDPLPNMNITFSLILQFEREFLTSHKDSRIQAAIASFVRNNPHYQQAGASHQGNFNTQQASRAYQGNFQNSVAEQSANNF